VTDREILNPWNVLSIGASFALIRWLLMGFLIASGWGLVARGTNHVSRVLKLSGPLHQSPRMGEKLKVDLITNGQWCNQSCLHNEVSIKIKGTGFRELLDYWINAQRGHSDFIHLPTYLILCISFIRLFICIICTCVSLSSVSYSIKLIKPEKGTMGTSNW
jgi:hypothetical protein